MTQQQRTPTDAAAPADDAGRTICWIFQKNATEQVVASLSTFKGEVYVDLRVHVEGPGGKVIPTRKGLTLRPDLLEDLERAVKALREAMEARGLAA